jgi:hypothetical protein
MSYSLDEALDDSRKYTAFLKALKEIHPDAIKTDGQWSSRDLTLENCDGFEIRTETRKESEYQYHYARFYQTVAGGRVFFQDFNRTLLDVAFTKIQEKDPEFYTLLLKKLREY